MHAGSYAFIYDDILNDKAFEHEVSAIEARLATLDLQGRVTRLALFRSAKDLVESMVSQGVTTCVILGNDRSLDKMMWFLPDMGVTVGYIPVMGPSPVADMLGIPVGVAACDVLAARLVETIDMGKIDDRYFLTEASLVETLAAVDIEGLYRVSSLSRGSVFVRNLGSGCSADAHANAKDGLLEVVIRPPASAPPSRWKPSEPVVETRILIRSGEIRSSDPVDVRVDNHVLNGFRFQLGIVPGKLKMITGRSRRLAPAGSVLPNATKAYTLPSP